ncbi:MAG: DUF502 domain-containing protein [Candidatus Eisenbacteria bacterium]|nr:DUF502 domain-containing protein [Candidatus Eisenbacteria bacterium]
MFRKLQKTLRSKFIAGILIVIPLGITYLMLRLLFNTVDNILAPLLTRLIGFKIPGLGLIATLIIIFALGFLAANVLGKRFILYLDGLMRRVPLVRSIYVSSKQFLEAVSVPASQSFKRVVIIEYPRKGIFAVGFVTKERVEAPAGSGRLTAVFIPSPPNPATGMVVLVEKSEIIDTDLNIEEAIKIILSGGVLFPEGLVPRQQIRGHQSAPKTEAKA